MAAAIPRFVLFVTHRHRAWPRATGAVALCALSILACERQTMVPARPEPSRSAPSSSVGEQPAPAPVVSQAPARSAASAEAPVQARLVVRLMPIGVVPQEMIDEAVKGLREHAPVDPIVEQAQDFPSQARTAEKGRYRAEALLRWLDGLPLDRGGKVMGITEADIVARKGNVQNWGILGMGSIDGRCSVISTWRMKRRWENGGAPDWLVRERLWKVSLHELGHTLGLEHCPTVGCIMEDGHGTVRTTDRDKELCPRCAEAFARSLEHEAKVK